MTAAADDRTFMLDTQPFDNPNSPNNQNFEPRTFLELRLSPGGDVVSMNRIAVSVPRGQLMTGFALSPDGRRLAIAVQPDNNKRDLALTEVKVITLATGATETWTADGPSAPARMTPRPCPGPPTSVRWPSPGRRRTRYTPGSGSWTWTPAGAA